MDNEREMLSIILLLLALVNISNGFLVWDNSAQSKRNSGMPEVCRGRYDAAIFTQLENICEDCYNLYKEPDVHQLCRFVLI